ncbi:MAG TPA: saccharopine dehydrogenase [Flavobacteriales bacterium]|nr:saccharopine dehydrogenase [Flavobacteriales bacterium]
MKIEFFTKNIPRMNNILVIGGGMVGSAICYDLLKTDRVTLWDIKPADDSVLLKDSNFSFQANDLFDAEAKDFHDFDLLVLAVPGFMGIRALEHILVSGKPIVDISFFPEDAFLLSEYAKECGSTVIVDCGVAPGFSNIVLGHHAARSKVLDFKCYVGGLPLKPEAPFFYKAPFSPIDVIEEYTRPARIRREGKDIELAALSELEQMDFGQYGVLEAFNTDGLRSLLKVFPDIPNMTEKTLRYPGHTQLIAGIRDAGFFREEEIQLRGKMVSPIELSSKLLIEQWTLDPKEAEFTLMRIEVTNEESVHNYLLYDERDEETGIASMSRTTGYTCTAAVQWLLNKKDQETGIFPPEMIAKQDDFMKHVIDHLRERNISIEVSSKLL